MNGTRLKAAQAAPAAGGWSEDRSSGEGAVVRGIGRRRRTVSEMAARLRAMEERHAALLEANRSLNETLSGAAQLQRNLSSPREIRRGRFEIASEVFPACHLSGDFYDVQEAGGCLTIAVGDIAGKGLVAGLWFTFLVGLVRLRAASSLEPAELASEINCDLRHFCEMSPTVALFVARLDIATGELEYSNAGQPPALLIRRGGPVELLSDGGPILGAIPTAEFRSRRTALAPGDTLVVASDGILECRNQSDEEFGSERLTEAVLGARGLPAVAALFSILGAAQDFAGGCAQSDDLTLMAIHHR
jgi:serine phosphatase RsbU (regulator of sigma subunit)